MRIFPHLICPTAIALFSLAALAPAQSPTPSAGSTVGTPPARARAGNPDSNPNPNRPVSPEVSADRRITFRLQAPSAINVRLLGDFTGEKLAMTKNDQGIWSYTTESLPAGYYQYWYEMDGLVMPDPVNTHVRPASAVYKSQVDIPGEGTAWMDFRDVPHGVLSEHLYLNKENATARRVVVYTPPGYGTSGKNYPVIYLLHGNADFERGWTQAGRANLIMDNLIADGKAVPAIIVMPFGHDVSGASGKLPELRALRATLGYTPPAPRTPASASAPGAAPAAGRGGFPADAGASFMEKDLLGLVIPLVEKEYRVLKGREHRAIFGYSMGGIQGMTIGLNHPELFSYVAGMSGYAREAGVSKALSDTAKANQEFKLVWIGCGTADATAYNGGVNMHRIFTEKGLRHEWVESPGYRHDYQVWRIYLRDLAPRLFRE
ncbi:MAG: alpha/beta hydrolase-fold protein [Opitutaceae bacterium]